MKTKKWLRTIGMIIGGGVLLIVIIQLIPYGKNHNNPPVVSEPTWDSQQTRDLAKQSCFDCHSNETVWPLYSKIAPVSWFVYHDVESGRRQFNFSDWQASLIKDPREFERSILDGDMPPLEYLWIHSNAKLTATEQDQLITGLQKTIAQ
jgi:hypothetical protein